MRRYGVLLSLLLGLRPRACSLSACVRLGDLSGVAQINLVLKTVSYYPKPRNDGNRLVGELLVTAPPVCLGPPCKVLNQSIVGLSPLSETTYPTGHDIPLWWNFVEIISMINCLYNFGCNSCLSRNDYSTRRWAKILKVMIHYLAAFWQTKPTSQKPCMIRGKVFLLDG
jgi:hypothetical protein